MLPIYDVLTGQRINAGLLRSQEFRTGLSETFVSCGIVELDDNSIRLIRVLKRADMHGNFRTAEKRYGVDFETAVGSLKVELRGRITEIMPEYNKPGREGE